MIASPDIATHNNAASADHRAAQGVREDSRPAHPAADPTTPRQRWAHLLVLDLINANLPLPRLADHLKIPFDTLIAHINTPEVQAEINAYEALINLRARLLGETARPISLRRLLDVLESPAPRPGGSDPDADQRALHRHAELIRRTATTIARESRALAPAPPRTPKPSRRTANVSERTAAPSNSEPTNTSPSGATSSRRAHKGEPELVLDDSNRSENVSEWTAAPSNCESANTSPSDATSSRRAHKSEPELVPDDFSRTACVNERTRNCTAKPGEHSSAIPGRNESPARQSPTDALRAAAGSTQSLHAPHALSRRARDHPPHPAA